MDIVLLHYDLIALPVLTDFSVMSDLVSGSGTASLLTTVGGRGGCRGL